MSRSCTIISRTGMPCKTRPPAHQRQWKQLTIEFSQVFPTEICVLAVWSMLVGRLSQGGPSLFTPWTQVGPGKYIHPSSRNHRGHTENHGAVFSSGVGPWQAMEFGLHQLGSESVGHRRCVTDEGACSGRWAIPLRFAHTVSLRGISLRVM